LVYYTINMDNNVETPETDSSDSNFVAFVKKINANLLNNVTSQESPKVISSQVIKFNPDTLFTISMPPSGQTITRTYYQPDLIDPYFSMESSFSYTNETLAPANGHKYETIGIQRVGEGESETYRETTAFTEPSEIFESTFQINALDSNERLSLEYRDGILVLAPEAQRINSREGYFVSQFTGSFWCLRDAEGRDIDQILLRQTLMQLREGEQQTITGEAGLRNYTVTREGNFLNLVGENAQIHQSIRIPLQYDYRKLSDEVIDTKLIEDPIQPDGNIDEKWRHQPIYRKAGISWTRRHK
jgi:hypothetical protein